MPQEACRVLKVARKSDLEKIKSIQMDSKVFARRASKPGNQRHGEDSKADK